ncbi:type III secretion HpaP family protein [Telmatospirillum sp. J64-1]|uniref:type III secretion HpaP family protein n=1 Tax=Telmatospirillum sp. J64-1 TaxID=2502183 RepID=UPI00115F3193|nr:type III secretion HpaP family protein [Telmatospirillum sp. J64-1]
MSQIPPSINGLGAGTGTGSPSDGLSNERRPADGGDTRHFDEMMRGNREREPGGSKDSGTGQQDGGGEQPQSLPNPFDLLRPGTMPSTAPAAAPSPLASADLTALADTVAERILVSDENADGSQEVRIQLKENVLPGTEIRLRHEGGRLVVELVCANADSLRFLDSQRDGLSSLLNSRLKDEVQVRVTPAGPGEGSGQPQDGRSREEYLAEDEDGKK